MGGSYDTNMERLDLNIRILTELIQEQIQQYIYYETTNLEALREGIRSDVDAAIRMSSLIFCRDSWRSSVHQPEDHDRNYKAHPESL